MTRLFRIEGGALSPAPARALPRENMIEAWVADDLSLVGVAGVMIGRQVATRHGGRIDLLVLDEDGNLIVVELKRDRTLRDVVAQSLDYASWVHGLSTKEVHDIADAHLAKADPPTRLGDAYRARFDKSLPDTLNAAHQVLIVASQLDEASKRIVEYLSEVHDLGINVSFFNVFGEDGAEWLTTDTLLDQEEVKDRAVAKTRAPWTGYYYVTGGPEEMRPWDDLRRLGILTASGGRWYTDKLKNLSVGDEVFYYQPKNGYLGYGVVTREREAAADYELEDGRKLTEALPKSYITASAGDPELQAYAVGVDWEVALPVDDARTFNGAFASQHPVCKLSHRETADFLEREFGLGDRP